MENVFLEEKTDLRINDYFFLIPVILMGISAVFSVSIFCYIALVFGVLLAITHPLEILPVLCVTSLSTDFFAVADGLGAVRVFSIAYFIGIFIRIFKSSPIIESKWLKWILYIFGIIAISSFINDGTINSNPVMRISLSLLIVITSANVNINENKFSILIKKIVIAYFVISLLVISSIYFNPSILWGRTSLSETLNANRTAMMCAQLGTTLAVFGNISVRRAEKWVYYIIAFLDAIIVVMTGSRAGLIAIVAGVAITLFIDNISNGNFVRKVFLFTFAVFLVYFLFLRLLELNQELAARYTLSNIIESKGTHRWDSIVAEIQYIIPQHPVFGVGLNKEIYWIHQYTGQYHSSHNIIVTMFTEIGVFGAIGVIGLTTKVIKSLIKSVRINSYALIPLAMLFTGIFNGVGEIIYFERFFWCAMALAIMAQKCCDVNYIESRRYIE